MIEQQAVLDILLTKKLDFFALWYTSYTLSTVYIYFN